MRTNVVVFLAMAFLVSLAFATPYAPDKATYKMVDPGNSNDELDEIVWSEDFEGDVSDWSGYDPAIQPTYWQTDEWMPYGGTMSWRCFNPDYVNDWGGYQDNWLQFMETAVMDFSGAGSAELNFWFRAYIEDGNWDGANVWVRYGDDPNNLTLELATPTTPAYTEADCWAFELWFGDANDWPGWAGEGTEPFNDTYTQATFDLSAYTGYTNVQVIFAFSSDVAYNTADNPDMYGFQVDDIDITADGTTVWADDADGNNIGGDPTFITGAAAAGQEAIPMQWEVFEPGNGPPSPTHALGIDQYVNGYNHYFEGPTFNLPTLEPGESLWLDHWLNNDWEDEGGWPLEERFYWRPEVYDPTNDQWWAASNVGGWSGTNYVYVGSNGAVWEPFSESGYTYDWSLDELAGVEGVRVRMYLHSPQVIHDFSHMHVDDITVEVQSLQHDISTMLIMPYPTSVATPVYGQVIFSNNAPNDESGFMGVWSLNGPVYPLYPVGPYDLPAGETLELAIDDPTDPDNEGYWMPSATGDYDINAYHTLVGDEIPENDDFPTAVEVMAEGEYELGTDSRNYFGTLSVTDPNDGPVVHIDPATVNSDLFGDNTTYDITELRMYGFFHSAAGGAPANCTMDFTVYGGGDVPGAEIHTGTYEFTENQGYTGDTWATLDVSGVAALQGMSGDFWIWAQFTTLGPNGAYYQPFPYRTGGPLNQETQFYNMADAENGDPIADFGHHVTAVVENLGAGGPVALDLTPTGSTTVPATGGTVDYDVHLQSFVDLQFPGANYWTSAVTPSGNDVGPLFLIGFTLQPFMDVTVPMSVDVPGGVPAGDYEFYGHAGVFPVYEAASDMFVITKEAGALGIGTEWGHSNADFGTAGEATAEVELPSEYALSQAYPNPFNPSTAVAISLPEAAELNVTVFNVMGQQVAELANGQFNAGVHTLTFDASGLSSGIYFIQAEVPGQLNELRKVTLMK